MTRLRLSVSDMLQKQFVDVENIAATRVAFNFFYAVQALRLFTFLWLYWTVKKYLLLQQRPADVFWFDQAIPNWLMPSLPPPLFFYGVVGVVAVCNLLQLARQKTYTRYQIPVALSILWLNLAQWGYGFLSHINHLFVLAHLFLVFIPIGKASLQKPTAHLAKSINWFYAGLLFTYTLAGLWKVPSLAYKLLTNSPDVHWLHPNAALYNAFVSFRSLDIDFTLAPLFTDYALFWQLSFLIVVYLQATSVLGAYRPALRPWLGLFLLVFHTVNMLAFQIYFVVASFVLICLFMPYDVLFYKWFDELQTKARNAQISVAVAPRLTPFEKYRERIAAKHFYLSGLLYLPGLRTLANMYTRLILKQ